MVTINPAMQLGIDKRVGSIDVGKDADLVIYNHDPLSAYAVVQKTLIDGRVYFDRARDIAERADREKEKKALIEKEKKAAEKKPRKEVRGQKTKTRRNRTKNLSRRNRGRKTPPMKRTQLIAHQTPSEVHCEPLAPATDNVPQLA